VFQASELSFVAPRKVKTARCQSTNIYHNRTVHHSYWRQAVVASFTTAALQNAAHTRRSAKSDFETIRWIQRAQLLEFHFKTAKSFVEWFLFIIFPAGKFFKPLKILPVKKKRKRWWAPSAVRFRKSIAWK
jgi:hypothetical protein